MEPGIERSKGVDNVDQLARRRVRHHRPDTRWSIMTDRRRWAILGLLCLAAFMIVLDTATVLAALPAIQADLDMSPSELQWVVTAYTLAFGGFMLLCGRLADRFDRRAVLMIGVLAFTVTSVICGLAWSGPVLVVARFLQGVAAASVFPAALSLLLKAFPEGVDRNRALGIWSAVGGVGGVAGLAIGGPLTDGPGWEWIFYINAPVGLVVLVFARLWLPSGARAGERLPFDVKGALMATVGLVLVVWAISSAPDNGWLHPMSLVPFAAGVLLLGLFWRGQHRIPQPLVPPRLFRSRIITGGNLVLVIAGITVSGTWFIVTLFTQGVLNYTATEFSLLLTAPAGASILGAIVGQRLVSRWSIRAVGVVSMSLIAVGLFAMTPLSHEAAFWQLLVPTTVIALAFGAGAVAASIAALTGVPEEDSGIASGVQESAFQIGTPLGTAILVTVAVSVTGVAGTGVPATVAGYRAAFLVAGIFAVVGAVIASTLFKTRAVAAPTEEGVAASAK